MRIGAVADHRTRVAYHFRCHIGVIVETRGERGALADNPTDAAHQLAFAILVVLGHHRPVQIEIDRVDRSLSLQILDDPANHLLVGLALDIRGGRRRAPAQWHEFVAQRLQRLYGTGDRDVEPLDRIDQLRPAHKTRPGIGALKIRPGRLERGKGIGLVLEPADRDARHG